MRCRESKRKVAGAHCSLARYSSLPRSPGGPVGNSRWVGMIFRDVRSLLSTAQEGKRQIVHSRKKMGAIYDIKMEEEYLSVII